MRITLLQYAPIWEDRRATRGKISSLLKSLEATDWIVLPEMALSGFSMNSDKTAWDADDFTFFSDLARARGCTVTVGGVEERRNTAFIFAPSGELQTKYVKQHLFSYAKEDQYYVPGIVGSSYRVGGLRVGQAICYDMRFPYHFWCEAANVEAYCVIAAWGGKRAEHWKTLLRARAIENQAYVLGVNRIGEEPNLNYSGNSAIIDPLGNTVLDCGENEGAFTESVDISVVLEWRNDFPALKDRRS